MRGAQPTFRLGSLMRHACELLKFEVGSPDVRGVEAARADGSVYRLDVRGIDAPDAEYIETFNPKVARELLEDLDTMRQALAEIAAPHRITATAERWKAWAQLAADLSARAGAALAMTGAAGAPTPAPLPKLPGHCFEGDTETPTLVIKCETFAQRDAIKDALCLPWPHARKEPKA